MQSIAPPETTQQQRLKRGIRDLIHQHLQESINPYWLVSFHYTDNKTHEAEVLNDTQDLKQKLHRIIYQARDKTIRGAGAYPYPRLLFFHEISHQGTGQYHTISHAPDCRSIPRKTEYPSSSRAPIRQNPAQQGQSIIQVEIHRHPTHSPARHRLQTHQQLPD